LPSLRDGGAGWRCPGRDIIFYQAVKIFKVVNTNIPGNCSFPEELGFLDSASAHTGRTIMFRELLLLEVTPHEISFDEIRRNLHSRKHITSSIIGLIIIL
jgi:hypothetical protein